MLRIILACLITLFSVNALAYDPALAESYEKFFSGYAGKDTGKALQMVSPADFSRAAREKKDWFVLDVRTPNETIVYGITGFETLVAPMNEVFQKENLDKLPENKRIVVVCGTGLRANSIATALRHSGYKNTYILSGGTKALADYVKPKTVY